MRRGGLHGAAPLGVMLALALPGGAARAQTFLSYLNAPQDGEDIAAPPRLRLSFGGKALAAVMDTGSTGIVVAAGAIPVVETLPDLGPGTLTYSSSGRIMRGTWVRTVASIQGGNGATVTTVPIPVLAVTRVDCLQAARACAPDPAPRHIAMLGIGFGRQGDHQAEGTPDRNPFLNLAAGAGRGYVVTRTGVLVGPDEAGRRGFATVALARSKRFPDWAQAPACITVDTAAPACGVALIDTGVTAMYLSVPSPYLPPGALAPARTALRPGTAVRIDLADTAAPKASYTLTAGDTSSPLAPDRIVLVPRGAAFVNTGVRFLNGFDVLFDADQGLVGYRRRGGITDPAVP